jgi:hypothetical protein
MSPWPIPDMLPRLDNVRSRANGGHAGVDSEMTDLAVDTRSGGSQPSAAAIRSSTS